MVGVKASWLRDEAEAGRVPALRAGDTWLFDLHALERALLARIEAQPPATGPEGGDA